MARISLVALRTLGTSSARQPGRSSGARRPRDAVVAVRSWIAFRARAVVDVARPVVVHILGREVAPAVLVQIPAVVAIATRVACGTLRAVVTLRTLRSRRAVAPRRSIRSRRARHPVVTRVALGSLSTLGTFAIQDRAGSVVIQILGSQITLAIFVYIPAVEAVRAHRTLRTGHARVTLRTPARLGDCQLHPSNRVPRHPSDPEHPADPARPADPDRHDRPGRPSYPAHRADPDHPADPERPADPGRPGDQVRPEHPADLAFPGSQENRRTPEH